jgi:hypothetical protein
MSFRNKDKTYKLEDRVDDLERKVKYLEKKSIESEEKGKFKQLIEKAAIHELTISQSWVDAETIGYSVYRGCSRGEREYVFSFSRHRSKFNDDEGIHGFLKGLDKCPAKVTKK